MNGQILLLLMLSLGPTTNAAYNATFQLKEQYIPPDGVVILSDIGGGLGARHGLFCEVNNTQSDVLLNDVYWAFPNNSQIVHPPPTNSDQYGNGSCYLDYIDRCTSLYYDGAPTERGQFHCVLEWNSSPPPQPIEYEMVPVHIVDLTTFNVTGPHGHVYAGEDITLSVGVSVDPDNTPIPYQWQLNGDDLSDSDRYKGTNTARLRIINIQDENKGEYRVSVAHSESRFSSNVTISVVTVRAEIIPSQDEPPYLGEDYALTCNETVIGVDQASLHSPTITYTWFKNSTKLIHQEQTISFRSLTYEDTGNYSCQVSVHSTTPPYDLNATTSFPVLTYDVIYQLSLDIFNDECKEWIRSDTKEKVDRINERIIDKINSQCGDNTTDVGDGIKGDEHAFRCRTAQDGHVVYNVHLLQTTNAIVTKLVTCTNSWVTQTATILVNGAVYDLNKACSGVLLDSDSNPFICPWLPPTSKSKLDVGAGIGIGIGIGIITTLLGVQVTKVIIKRYKLRDQANQPIYRNAYNNTCFCF